MDLQMYSVLFYIEMLEMFIFGRSVFRIGKKDSQCLFKILLSYIHVDITALTAQWIRIIQGYALSLEEHAVDVVRI